MRNFDMKTREITDTDLELVSAAGDFGAAVAGGLAGAIVGSIVGGGVGGVIAAAVSGAAVGDAGSHLEDKVNER